MNDYLADEDRLLLQSHGLDSFQALWNLQLTAVDEPNDENGGWSSVYKLELEGRGFFLKRQCNYFTRTFHRPFGEPTVAREFRNIMRYQRLGIPSLHAVFYGERKMAGEHRAVLLTRALDGWLPLLDLLQEWRNKDQDERFAIIAACAELIGRLHAAGLRHGCLYPKHLFLRIIDGRWQGCLIDLEKTRRLWWGWRDQVRDLVSFLRSVQLWDDAEQQGFLEQYLHQCRSAGSPDLWRQRLDRRRRYKEKRR